MKRSSKTASKSISDRSFAEIAMRYELEHIPKFTGCEARDSDGDVLLHKAAFRGDRLDVRDLVRLGSDINASGDMGNTALHYAAMRGHLAIAEALIELNASHTLLNEFKQTAADMAEIAGHKQVVTLLKTASRRSG